MAIRRSRTAEKKLHIFSGSVHPELADEIADYLDVELGDVRLEKFSNGECYARFMDSIRGEEVFLVQSVSGEVNDALMELLIMVDAAKRASAAHIHAVITHYGYARQDRKSAAREPITAKLVADLLQTAGASTITTIDLHQGQIQGFFDIPVNHLTALNLFADYFKESGLTDDLCVVSPDVGRAKAAKKMSDLLDADLAIMHKGRPQHNVAEITSIIGDVEGKNCILNDDMIDTAGTICAGMKVLKDRGAKSVHVCATHPIFSGPAYERLESSVADEVVVCNTIPIPAERLGGKIKTISCAPLFAQAINNVFTNDSVSSLFDPDFAL